MSTRLGLSVSAHMVRAILWARGGIAWVGSAPWADHPALADAVARLAGEAGRPVQKARIVLERDIAQLRTIVPAPPLNLGAARRYVALETARLFRKNGVPLVTDAVIVVVDRTSRALWAAAAPEPLLRAILEGCAQAGLIVESLGPASDVVAHAVQEVPTEGELIFPNGGTSEIISLGVGGAWRSRHVAGMREATVAWHPAVEAMGSEAAHFAPAFAATIALPRLQLLPADTRAARERAARRAILRFGFVAVLLWLLAGAIYGTRLYVAATTARRELDTQAAAVDSALALRRELDAARATLAEFAAAEHGRSRQLELVAALAKALGDSAYIVTLRVGPDATVRLAGYAPSAPRAVADLEKARVLEGVRLEGPVTRERIPSGAERDRLAIVAHLKERP